MKFIIFISTFVFSVFAGTPSKRSIIKDTSYFYGEGTAQSQNNAERQALLNLSKNVSTTLFASDMLTTFATEKSSNYDLNEVVHSYTNTSLSNVNQIVKREKDGTIVVFKYVKKEDVILAFKKRSNFVTTLYNSGMKCRAKGQYSEALKQYYYALLILNSIPIAYTCPMAQELRTTIPIEIKETIRSIKFVKTEDKQLKKQERTISFKVTNNSKNLGSLSFWYWDGNQEVQANVKDGKAVITLFSSSIKFEELKIRIEYVFESERSQYQLVKDLWKAVIHPQFDNKQNIQLTKKTEPIKKVRKSNYNKSNLTLKNQSSCPIYEIRQETEKVLSYISGDEKLVFNLTSDSLALTHLRNFVKYNKPKLFSEHVTAEVNQTPTGWEVRRIPIVLSYSDIRRNQVEYLIIDFDKEGRLFDISVAVNNEFFNEILRQSQFGNDWDERFILVKFIEKYRSAYLYRCIETLETIFADEAVIIVGRIRKAPKEEINPISEKSYQQIIVTQPSFEKIFHTKESYLKKQRNIFNIMNSIHLNYTDFSIRKHNKTKGLYGVSLRQQYSSSTYSDEGYLFLLVDFFRKDPQIYVRAWQPQEWDEEDLIDMSNFRVH